MILKDGLRLQCFGTSFFVTSFAVKRNYYDFELHFCVRHLTYSLGLRDILFRFTALVINPLQAFTHRRRFW
jgi:hypothetical protein